MKKLYKNPWQWCCGLKNVGITVLALFGAVQGLNAQVNNYTFSQSSGTFNSISATGTLVTGSDATTITTNDTSGWPVTIPFNFNFNGTGYTSIYLNSNGGATFGTTTSTSSGVISATTAYSGAIGVMNRDLWGVFVTSGVTTSGSNTITNVASFKGIEVGKELGNTTTNGIPAGTTVTAFNETAGTITMSAAATLSSSTAVVRYGTGKIFTSVEGTAPNRVFVIEWKGYNDYGTTADLSNYLNFQLRLSETSNSASVVYGPNYNIYTTARTNQIGLRGASASDFNNRSGATGTAWTSTTAGTSNSATVSRDNTNFPASGLTYVWTPPSCYAPSALTVASASITASGATASWTAALVAPSGYEVYYSTSNTAPSSSTVLNATNSVSSTTTSAPISGLASSTTYYVWVRSSCSGTDKSTWTAVTSFTTLATCFAPTAIVTTGSTSATIDLSWTAATPVPTLGYEIYYSTSSTAPSSSTPATITNITGTTYTIPGLAANTAYYIWVRSKCSSTDQSTWSSSVTGYTGYCVPTGGSSSTTYYLKTITTTNAVTNLAYTASSYSAYVNNATTTSFSSYPGGSFNYALANSTTATCYFYIWVDWNNDLDFNDAGETMLATTTYAATSSGTFTVPSTQALGSYRARIALSESGAITSCGPAPYGNYVDFTFNVVAAPSCLIPTAVTFTGASSNTANVSWTAPTPAPAQGYEIYYSTSSTAPSSSTPATITNITGTTYTIPGLAADTTYYIWVRSKCSSTDQSAWSTSTTAYTGYCVPTGGSGSTTYYLKTITTTNAVTNLAYTASSYSAYVNNATTTSFSSYPGGSFNYALANSTTATCYFYIWVDWNNDLDFNDAGETVLATTTYAATSSGTFTVPSTQALGSYRARIALSESGAITSCGPAPYGNYVDFTFNVVAAPTCFAPTGITMSNITGNSATVSWTAATPAPAQGYDIYYSTSNTAPAASATPNQTGVTALTTSISPLSPLTTYYVWVRSHCTGSDLSAWSAVPVSFQTLCQPPALLSTTGATICGASGSATISATTDAGAVITWYDAATNGNVLATGNSYTTPVISANTTYYVSTKSNGGIGTVGPANPSVLGSVSATNYAIGTYYQIFDVITPTTLVSIDVFPTSSTAIGTSSAIEIRDSSGATLVSVPYTVAVNDGTTAQTVTLNYALPVGTGYRIGQGVAIYLNRNTAGATYPFTSSAINVTGNNFSSGPNYWYYIYNWKFSSSCESARQPVVVNVNATCLGTSETTAKEGIQVYPNPFADVLNISDVNNVKSISVVDIAGRLVKTFDKPTSTLHLGELNSGMYLVVLNMKDGSKQTIKAIKK
ncbi:fibronectin type III domain-containing protein [Chryseobacterium sp. RG1]|uniref:Fibronectin type III domain-containing protein n=1 Tax=Chryseobacterium tagetis TaxID=2801334 RepID=A0ABS7ZV36_9FLAO|nr:fibronectin type III domain-containing protein [Chryseobacterium tagetis]MCA6065602.1 fibronectin type III domain-containing protein [Chryseobacterium tagetis]